VNDFDVAVGQLNRGNVLSIIRFVVFAALFAATVAFVYSMASTIPDQVAKILSVSATKGVYHIMGVIK
jgi:hypothetical protein